MKGAEADILEIVNFIKDNMATRTDIGELRGGQNALRADLSDHRVEFNDFRIEARGEFRELRREIADISTTLDTLESSIADIRGYAKELDGLRERIRTIERHLGLTQSALA